MYTQYFVDGAGTTVAFYSNRMRICVECRHIFSTLALLKGLCLSVCVYDYAMMKLYSTPKSSCHFR